MGDVIDLPDNPVDMIAFDWRTFATETSFFWKKEYAISPLAYYFWGEAEASILYRRIVFYDMKTMKAFQAQCSGADIDQRECILLDEAIYESWAKLSRAYTVTDVAAQKDELALILSHYSTPESH